MASIYPRRGRLWARLKHLKAPGRWGCKRTPFLVGHEDEAQKYADLAQERLDARHAIGAAGPLTVRAYATRWLEDRRAGSLDWRNDESRLRIHVLPAIGGVELARVRPQTLIDLFRRVRGKVAPRTVYNVYAVVSALFRDARLAGLIDQSPCILDERQLGPRVDSADFDRAEAVFSREEATAIISTPDIPPDRRVVYALELLAGIRTGETAALRWRRYDPATQPLGCLTVAKSYSTRADKEKGTKTESVRYVPVHPTLAAILAEWKLSGWAAMMGRAPGPDDLIVPLPPAHADRRRTRTGDPFRGHDYSGKRWREEDLPALGWRHRQHYDMRATFITLALEDGADPTIIETRVTHTKRKRSAFGGYNRGLQWEQTCAEVAKLRLARTRPDVPGLEVAVADAPPESPGDLATPVLHDPVPRRENGWRRRESNPRKRSPVVTDGQVIAGTWPRRVATDGHERSGDVASLLRDPAAMLERVCDLLLDGDKVGATRIAVQIRGVGAVRRRAGR